MLCSPPALLCWGLSLGSLSGESLRCVPLSRWLLSCTSLGCPLLSGKPASCQWLRHWPLRCTSPLTPLCGWLSRGPLRRVLLSCALLLLLLLHLLLL